MAYIVMAHIVMACRVMAHTGTFYLASETEQGAALLVEAGAPGAQKVYEVWGIASSLGDLLRSGGHSLPGWFQP